jgi:hypothetical protein
MTVPPLFRLPQELRDQIYKYVLQNETGLCYRSCRGGEEKLCTRNSSSSLRSAIFWLYQYSFGHARRMCYICKHENNHLKYVCKRLHYETTGLELRYNTIFFEDAATDALEQCISAIHHDVRLHTVAIKCSPLSFAGNYGSGSFSRILRHCEAQPNLLVKIYIPYWSQANPNFLPLGLNFLTALRRDTRLAHRLSQLVSHGSVADLDLLPVYGQIPINLRIMPKEEVFSDHTFEKSCEANPMIVLPAQTALKADVIAIVSCWFEIGL